MVSHVVSSFSPEIITLCGWLGSKHQIIGMSVIVSHVVSSFSPDIITLCGWLGSKHQIIGKSVIVSHVRSSSSLFCHVRGSSSLCHVRGSSSFCHVRSSSLFCHVQSSGAQKSPEQFSQSERHKQYSARKARRLSAIFGPAPSKTFTTSKMAHI